MSVEIDGYDVAPLVNGAGVTHTNIEAFERAANGGYEGTIFARKQQWSFRLAPTMTDNENRSLRGWVTGQHWSWNFDRVDGATTRFNRFEDAGGVGWVAGTGFYSSSATSKFGSWGFSPSSSHYSAVTLNFNVVPGFSWGVWKHTSVGYKWCAHTWDAATHRYTVNGGSSTTTAFAWSDAPTGAASAPFYLRLYGETDAGASTTTAVYDGAIVCPYAWTNGQIDALAGRTYPIPFAPYVEFDGGLNDAGQAIVVKGTIEDEDIQEVAYGGGTTASRWLRISLTER